LHLGAASPFSIDCRADIGGIALPGQAYPTLRYLKRPFKSVGWRCRCTGQTN
jgi:hypothetical protein